PRLSQGEHKGRKVLLPECPTSVRFSEIQRSGVVTRRTPPDMTSVTLLQRQTTPLVQSIEIDNVSRRTGAALDLPTGRHVVAVPRMDCDDLPALAGQRFFQGSQMGLRHDLTLAVEQRWNCSEDEIRTWLGTAASPQREARASGALLALAS